MKRFVKRSSTPSIHEGNLLLNEFWWIYKFLLCFFRLSKMVKSREYLTIASVDMMLDA